MGNNTCEVGGEPLFTPTPHVCDVGGWGRQGEALPSGDLISESGQETGLGPAICLAVSAHTELGAQMIFSAAP